MVKVYKSKEIFYFIEEVKHEEKMEIIQKPTEDLSLRAKEEALCIISQAQCEASAIIAEAEKRKTEIFNKSKEEGFDKGINEARKKCESEINNAKKEAEQIIYSAKEEKKITIDSIRQEILDMSFDIAEKIIGIELDRNDKAFASLIENAVNKAGNADEINITLNEDDYMKHTGLYDNDNRISIEPSLKKGEVKVYTEKGTIDAGVGKQLHKAKSLVGVAV